MATSGSVKTNSYSGRYLIFSWSQKSQSIENNTTTISWTLKGAGGSDVYYMTGPVSLKIDGVEKGKYYTTRTKLWNGTQVASGTTTFTHDSTSGEKSFTVAIEANIYVGAGANPNCTGSSSFSLNTIPRTPTFTTSPKVTNKTETSITIDRGATDISSSFYYKVGSGSWVSMANQTTTISNLSANTNYSITIQARNSNNTSLTKNANLSETTYNYPYFTSKPDFVIGSNFTIQIYNPLGRSVEIQGQGADGSTTIFSQSGMTGTSCTISNDTNKTVQYSSIPNSKDGIYKVRLVRGNYGGTSSWENGGKYSIVEADCKPTLAASNITYTNDSATSTLMGDTTSIIQGQSTITVKLAQAATPKYSATIVSYSATINNNTQAITVNTNKSFGTVTTPSAVISVTATDSRGLTVTQTKAISVIPYTSPKVNVDAKRDGGYGSNVTITMTPIFSDLKKTQNDSIRNSYTLTGTYTKKGGSTVSFNTGRTNSTSTSAATKALSNIDNDSTYTFTVTITDKFGNSDSSVSVGTGIPTLTIMPNYQSVGINAVPANSNYALDVNGNARFNNNVTIEGSIQKDWYAVVGQSSNTAGANTWYKFASIDLNNLSNEDRNIWFKVYSGYGDGSNAIGELIAHVRTNANKVVDTGSTQLKWITCGSGLYSEKFVMAYYNDTSGESPLVKIELWANVDSGWRNYKFVPQVEGDRTKENTGQWTLYKTRTASGQAAPTEGYTLINSSILTLKNSISGNANTSSTFIQRDANRITTPNLAHEYISNKATKRLDTATSAITEADPGDGWIETYFWDTSSPWDTQLYIPNGSGRLKKRVRANAESWPSTWQEIAYYSDIPVDSGWQNISRASGYNAGSLGTPQYKKVGSQVFIRGSWSTSNNIGSSSVTLGTLPSGFRPAYESRWIVPENGTGYIGRISIDTNGAIKLDWFGNTFGSRDTTTFTNIVTNFNFWID